MMITNIYLQILLLDIIVVYLVDLSGAMSNDGLVPMVIKKFLGIRKEAVVKIPGLSCSLCMSWWVSLFYILVSGNLSIPNIAFVACLSYLSTTINSFLVLIKETLDTLISWLYRKL